MAAQRRIRPRRPGFPAAVLLLGVALGPAGCATTPLSRSVSEIAERLAASLEQRKDARALRILVYEIHATEASNPRVGRASAAPAHGDDLGTLLEHELVVALAPRLNIVEAERAAAGSELLVGAGLKRLAEHFGANAVLAGDYLREEGGGVRLSLRIIDVDSMLVVAAATGVIPAGGLDDHSEAGP